MDSPYARGAALFDPVSMRVVYLSQDETTALVAGAGLPPEFQYSGTEPVIIDAADGRVIPIPSTSFAGCSDYAAAVRQRWGDPGMVSVLAGFRIVVTDRCNMKCSYCFVDTNTGARDITLDEIEEGFELLIDLRGTRRELTYQWFGGEPLLRQDLLFAADRIAREKASALGLSTRPTVVTNGTVLNERLLEHFAEYSYGVGISLDGPPEINRLERRLLSGKATERFIEKNIRRLLDFGIHVGVNVTPTAGNCHRIRETIEYVLSLGVKFVYVNSPIPIREYWVEDGAAWAHALYEARLFALSRGAMLFSHLDRVYQAIDSRQPRMFEHRQGCGGLNAALLSGGRLSVLDLNWRHAEYVFPLVEVRSDPTLLSRAAKKLHPSPSCRSCLAAGICGGPSINDRLLIGRDEPLPQYCDFFQTATRLAVLDPSGLQ